MSEDSEDYIASTLLTTMRMVPDSDIRLAILDLVSIFTHTVNTETIYFGSSI